MKLSLSAVMVSLSLVATSSSAFAEDLATVYQQALKSDPTVLKAQAEYFAAQEGIDQARAVLLPQIGASAGYNYNNSESRNYNSNFGPVGSTLTSKTDSMNYGASLNMQLYHHDSWLRMGTAKKSAHLRDLTFQTAKQQLLVRVTTAYFDVLKAQDDLAFANAEKKAIERQLEQTKQRFAVGLTAITDVHEAQAQFDNAVTSVIRSENAVTNAKEALRTITNVFPGELAELDTSTFSTSAPLPASANEWQQIAEEKSLEIITQKVASDIAKENINIAKAGHLPTLDLNGSFNSKKSKSKYNDTQDSWTPYYDTKSVGITFSVPIYSGGATSSAVRQAQQNYVAAGQDLELTHRSVVQNARNAYNQVLTSISAIKSLEQSVVSAESALKATEAGFEVGTRTIVDVLNSTRNVYNAKRNLSSTRYGYIEAVLALKRAAGTISEQDLMDINKGLAK